MMGGRGPIPCKFGVQCHRQDCWYSHPAGRAIDTPGGASGASGARSSNGIASNGSSRGAPGGPAPGMSAGGARAGIGGAQALPRMAGGGGNECRYSFECKRVDCHFSHPFGRAIDADGGAAGGGGGRPALNRPPSNGSMGSMTRGMSELSFGSYPPANATDDEQDLRDTWFPKARDCTCCKGYVYGCTADICESMGQCTCSIEEKDLDGSSSVSDGSMSRTGSPQVGMGANGAPMGMGGEGLRPPHPPTEAVLAAMGMGTGRGAGAAGGGGRSGHGRGGGAECRYGTGCKRLDCSFGHPQGRNIDADGVSFGDFGAVGGGGGGGRSTADQDLMDTWYPDCRACACCKGYKHGCKTAACAEAGLCACSSGDGPTAPIADGFNATPSNGTGSGTPPGGAQKPSAVGIGGASPPPAGAVSTA